MNIEPLNTWMDSPAHSFVVAGPCSAETEEQVVGIATEIKKLGKVQLYRAGAWKPRTRPGTFEGVGEKCLPWLKRVQNEVGLKVSLEVATPVHIEKALKAGIDVLWIGARSTVNPFVIQELAEALKGVDIPVLVKNPINADLSLWLGALERFNKCGVTKLGGIHRGFSVFDKTVYRNPPLWKIPMELKSRFPGLPLICDPSHIAGNRGLLEEICQKAMDLDFDGLMIETHSNPKEAWSDAAQQITPDKLKEILGNLKIRDNDQGTVGEIKLEEVRQKIDHLDDELLEVLSQRRNIMIQVAELKKKYGMAAFDPNRMRQVQNKILKKGLDKSLPEAFIRELYNTIHEECVQVISENLD